MKKFIITFVLSATALAAASLGAEESNQAQTGGRGGDPERMLETRVEMLKKNLGLTPEQIEKLQPVFRKDQEKLTAAWKDSSLSQEELRAKMREIYLGSREEVEAVLTPEQKTKMKEVVEKRREEMQKRRKQAEGENK